MRLISVVLIALLGFSFAGCAGLCGETVQQSACAVAAPVAAPCFAPQADPCFAPQASPCGQFAAQQIALRPTGVTMRIGAAENARAMLGVPGDIVTCGGVALGEAGMVLGKFLKCASGALVPIPTPSLRYTYAAPATQAACETQQETYTVMETETHMVPQQVQVPKTYVRTVRRVVDPCATPVPVPQQVPCPAPPPPPISWVDKPCEGRCVGLCCGVPK